MNRIQLDVSNRLMTPIGSITTSLERPFTHFFGIANTNAKVAKINGPAFRIIEFGYRIVFYAATIANLANI